GPMVGDETSVPLQERVGLHVKIDHRSRPMTRDKAVRNTVGGFESGSWHLTVQDRELMSQYEDLGVFGAVASTAQHEEIQHQADKTIEGAGHPRILSAPPESDRLARNSCLASPD